MDPVELSITIDRPREEVFEYLADIANHPEFCDHYLKEWHLTRVDSYGRGAGARYRIDAPLQRFAWSDLTFVAVEPPRRIVAVGRGGKYNRIKTFASWTLDPASGGGTRVDFVFESATDISGWTVRDESSAHRCRFADGTEAVAGETRRVTSADPCWEPGRSPVWNNGGDLVLLLDENGRVVANARYRD